MGLVKLFKSIFNKNTEIDEYEDFDESQLPEEFKALVNNLKDEETMKHCSIRHQGEHDVLPYIFYNETKLFLSDLEKSKEAVIEEVLSIPYKEMEEKSPYTIEDFKLTKEEIKPNLLMIKLELCDKNMSVGNCHRIYFIFNNKLKPKAYFTIEESIGTQMLCSIDKKNNHINYGEIESPSQEKEKIISLI